MVFLSHYFSWWLSSYWHLNDYCLYKYKKYQQMKRTAFLSTELKSKINCALWPFPAVGPVWMIDIKASHSANVICLLLWGSRSHDGCRAETAGKTKSGRSYHLVCDCVYKQTHTLTPIRQTPTQSEAHLFWEGRQGQNHNGPNKPKQISQGLCQLLLLP